MNHLLLSLSDNFGAESIWNVLGRKPSQLFGKECGGSTIWMFFSLTLRLVVISLGLQLPHGVIFALPFWLQIISFFFPFLKESVPLLHVRLAESILGRISPAQLLVVFPAHFLGCILGAVLFWGLCPSQFSSVLDPIVYPQSSFLYGLVVELAIVAYYTIILLVIPEFLAVNRLSKKWLTLCVIPCFLIVPFSESPTLNPASLYALWYLRNQMDISNSSPIPPIQVEHLIGPILGALFAGFICLKQFPDDPTSWKRSSIL